MSLEGRWFGQGNWRNTKGGSEFGLDLLALDFEVWRTAEAGALPCPHQRPARRFNLQEGPRASPKKSLPAFL